jgi:hypothetical protein
LNQASRFLFLGLIAFSSGCKQSPSGGEASTKPRLVRALSQEAEGLPDNRVTRVGPFLFYSDQPLEEHNLTIDGLESLPSEIALELGIPASQRMVKVYLFSNQELFQEYVSQKYPLLPNRRAYFISQKRAGGFSEDLVVLTMMGPRVKQDLRHELTHASLHGVLKQVPLWLDEGIAEYFETDPRNKGFNPIHQEGLQRQWSSGTLPDLDRLESLSQVQQMHREEYRESWAWVYWMLRHSPEGKETLKTYLNQCRQSKTPKKIIEQLREKIADPNLAMMRSVGTLERNTEIGDGRTGYSRPFSELPSQNDRAGRFASSPVALPESESGVARASATKRP